ncbi:sensor histidine kinase [Lihuaxuella thermophila]|uniref:Sensor histidine kinase n=1 Tax=Lihuaxuella thermophila TaxID=1173111 RepID=A0A1H8GPY9_9BACL|nr:sensor histidine kinase [Lihuaxuella thermophila]SEN46046.1 two-component system, NarL family, sensor histidine kinase LiaS [Lihuaxuella thermophila]
MKKERKTSVIGLMVQVAVLVAAVVTLLVLFMMFHAYPLTMRVLLAMEWLNLPVFIWIVGSAVAAGVMVGLSYGYGLKKRLTSLIHLINTLKQGRFHEPFPALGNDEIGQIGVYLRQLAVHLKKQVVSLQQLSSEKAEWKNQAKREAIFEERQRLARELHDAVSQQLFALSMMLAAMERNGQLPEKERARISMMKKMALDTQKEMRALLLHLRPVSLEGQTLTEGLEKLFREYSAKRWMDIDWEIDPLPALSKGMEDHLFRIVQEGLSNVLRHAEASKLRVYLKYRDQQLSLRLMDNGKGFDVERMKNTSYGLRSIEERTHEMGGVLKLISLPGKGTQIEIKVPIIEQKGQIES